MDKTVKANNVIETSRICEEINMWYFAWILGVLLAVGFGIINAMWLETSKCLEDE